MEWNLPSDVRYIIDTLAQKGHRADIVGGCVRDLLRGVEPHDFDMTTDATPEEMHAAFSHERLVDTGIQHGTVTIILSGKPYELTTYRLDGDYKDHRHPKEVIFANSLREDMSRRDFTINAMAYHPAFGLTDFFEGQEDLRKQLIRTVGDPETRFTEDALRILRGLRFASVLQFQIDGATALAMDKCKELLSYVSAERKYLEVCKCIAGKNAHAIFKEYFSVLHVILPRAAFEKGISWNALSSDSRLLSLYVSKQTPADDFLKDMNDLHSDASIRVNGEKILNRFPFVPKTSADWLKTMFEIGKENTEKLADLWETCGSISPDEKKAFRQLQTTSPVYSYAQLNIRGTDLLSVGIRGVGVGEMLKKALFAVMEGICENKKEKLLSYIVEQATLGGDIHAV